MIKKLIIGSVVVVGGALLLAGTSAMSYVKMGVASVEDTIKNNIPIDVEIERARHMIEEIKPEIADNLRTIAREEVEVARLEKQVDSQRLALSKADRDMRRLVSDLQTDRTHFVYAKGKTYTADEVRTDLESRFKQYKTQEKTTAKLEQILAARKKTLNAAQQKLDAMLAAKRQLEVEVEGLQADLTLVQVAEASNSLSISDTQLSQTRSLIDDIRSRIEVAQKLNDSATLLDGNIDLDDSIPSDLVDQVADYLGDTRAEIEELVAR